MLTRNQILPVGSVITVRYSEDRVDLTIAVIIGHLTLRRDMVNRFDYTCVKFPQGVEDGLMYVNDEDIAEILYRAADYDERHREWMIRKFAEYKAYYDHYGHLPRPDIDKIRREMIHVETTAKHTRRFGVRATMLILSLSGAALLSVLSGTYLTIIGAVLFMCAGFLIAQK